MEKQYVFAVLMGYTGEKVLTNTPYTVQDSASANSSEEARAIIDNEAEKLGYKVINAIVIGEYTKEEWIKQVSANIADLNRRHIGAAISELVKRNNLKQALALAEENAIGPAEFFRLANGYYQQVAC